MQLETISSISTPVGEGAIAIVRLSGVDAVEIADRLYKGAKPLEAVDSHTINYGHILDPDTGETVEEVMVAIMRAPRTYTREDIVEINCHGGVHTINRVLQLTLKHGARMAEPGEFTKRAFLNGRIDLSQAEGVMDFIRSKTTEASKVANQQMQGRLKAHVEGLRQSILNILAQVEVNIDYPEYDDVEEATTSFLEEEAQKVKDEIRKLLKSSAQGKILREGLSTVIVGKPNVGKSSLLNYLIQDNKAIVTDVAGTTRDILEEYVNVNGIPLKLIDTAGIRDTDDIVEKIGVERSRQALKEAELILYVLNNNEPLTDEDIEILDSMADQNVINIVNKLDLEPKLDVEDLQKRYPGMPVVRTSIINGTGVDDLEDRIASLFFEGEIQSVDSTYVSNNRHIHLLEQAADAISDAIESAGMDVPVDIVQIDLVKTWELLGEVIGEDVSEQLIDQLFSQFCLGK
ncbi:tRNA uridine-5-carboxymethylaminomethyl(34) synthesis GTPase MnmE [Salinicoccus roseus]|jgi:tRNA modification GTPase|uniref:tRNA modification GTPase MnmE n=1 Tax=Salinicoccus roseus TaxID=45670 RepID=A0A265E3U7_9STAP|nr:tRNA uridine-5-carboxymethylaminomethyl(34) synthesis GTPase MnmE [Salinicoccus roseus]MBY8909954.1 tRNA uridine-5-carboxymethylaminomethyl(34) synthesis GTPase MnmE [Salinicoccus roseus]OZT76272.1 tRNA uridine-5-carboxymethylaminomethyl(34) synthesis GTPase MnmE [Salinicoccus roseus]RPE51168.1 tRNA modification GTPase trmE [Salinicoccus roseus]GGA77459.1 tRNA modification GTPase MnmE [Salinicoccus roseus]